MENVENLDVNSIFNWSDADTNTKNESNWTRYINKIENISLKWNNLNITVTTKRAFGDYIRWFLFFILRCIAVVLIPLYLISIFWLNFTDSFGNMNATFKNNIGSSLMSAPIFEQTKAVNDYIWLMDDLLEN